MQAQTKTLQLCQHLTAANPWAISHIPVRKLIYCPSCTVVLSCNTNLLLKIFCSNSHARPPSTTGPYGGEGSLAFTCQWLFKTRAAMCLAMPPKPPQLLEPLMKFSNSGDCSWPYDSFQLDLIWNLYSHQPQYLQSTDNLGLVARK